MSVIIRRPYCTESHADFFVRNITVCKGDLIASANGVVSQPVQLSDGGSPITVAEARSFIRDPEADEEELNSLIRAAAAKVQQDTGVTLLSSTWRMHVESFPAWNQPLVLPLYPIQSIDAFTYVDLAGDTQNTFTGSPLALPYLVDYARPVRLALDGQDTWPSDLRNFQPGTIDVTAGWETAADVPEDLKQAMRILIAQSWLFRENDVAGQGMTVTPTSTNYDRWIAPWVLPGV